MLADPKNPEFFLATTSRWRARKADVWTPPEHIPHHHDNDDCGCEPTLVYVRVSKVGERDPQSLMSPDIQLDAAIADCTRKNKRIVRVLSDIDKSGRTFRKRSVDDAIGLIKNGSVKSVTLWKWSRWGRNVEYSKAYLGKAKAAGGRVDSATEDFDQNTAIGRMTQGQVMLYDEFQSDLIGEGWQAAHSRRRAAGLPHSGRARFGYQYVTREALKAGATHGAATLPDGSLAPGSGDCELCQKRIPHFWPDVTQGQMLVELYQQYSSGESIRRLAALLNERGFRTTFGGRWTQQATGQMLDTGFAAGLIRERSPEILARIKAQEEQSGKKTIRNSLKTFDVWRTGAQPPLISTELWKQYMQRRNEMADTPPRSRVPVHTLSRLLFCEICSRRLTTKYAGSKRQHQWQCPSRPTHHPDTSVSISNAAAIHIIRDWVTRNTDPLSTGRSIDEIAQAAFGATNSTIRTAGKIRADIDTEMRAHDKLILMNARGRIDDAQFDIARLEFEANLAQLRAELEQTTRVQAVTGKPTYSAFESLDAVWDETLERDPVGLNAPLRELIAFVIISPALGRGRWHDSAERVEIVGAWDRDTKDRWLESRRRRFDA
jgi:site-specific DNA recombinase